MSTDGPDLSDDELAALADTPLARVALACRDLVGVTDDLRRHDAVWAQVVEDTEANASSIRSSDTAEDVVEAFLRAIEQYGRLAEPEKRFAGTYRFAYEYVGDILAGEKTATIRYDDDRTTHPGDLVKAATPDGTVFAHLRIADTAASTAGEALAVLDDMDGLARHGSPDAEALVASLNEHYAADIDRETPVRILTFERGDGGEGHE